MIPRRYYIEVQFNGQWGVYQTAASLKAAEHIAAKLSWPTRIYSLPEQQALN